MVYLSICLQECQTARFSFAFERNPIKVIICSASNLGVWVKIGVYKLPYFDREFNEGGF